MEKLQPRSVVEKAAADDTVKCAKCGRRNPRGTVECSHCSAHLYIECPHCTHRNPRSRRSCSECGKRLRHGLLKKMKRWVFGRSRKHAIFLTGLTILLAFLLCWGAFALAEFRLFDWR